MITYLRMVRDYMQAFLGTDETGQGVVEYSLIVGTVSVVLIAAFMTLGIRDAVSALAGDISTAITGRSSTGLTPP